MNPSLLASPMGVWTKMLPVDPAPTTAVMVFDEIGVNDFAGSDPNLTEVALSRLVPLIVTVVPSVPLVGLNEVISG